LHRPGHIKALDIDAGTAAGARQARRYSLICLSLHALMPTSSLAMRLLLLTQSRGTKTGQHESLAAREMLFVSDPEPGTKGEEPAGRGLMCVGFGANECESDWLRTDQ
jgi:hypothetical protein